MPNSSKIKFFSQPAGQAEGQATPGTLHTFFRTIDHTRERRPLNTPVPTPHKKTLKAGRTNPPPVVGPAGAVNADFLRRARPRAKAVVFPPCLPAVMASVGGRVDRDEPLTVEDLWQGPSGGPPHMPDADQGDCCSVCLQLLSHPVFYTCGHGHCYTCARIWLEEQWGCPQCHAIITREPFRIPVVDSLIAKTYGDWDTSSIIYDWSGLSFPVLPSPDNM